MRQPKVFGFCGTKWKLSKCPPISFSSQGVDSTHAACFVNALKIAAPCTLADSRISIFHDVSSMSDGTNFELMFMQGVTRALVVTPLVTPSALLRMQDISRLDAVDNVLLEWWLALTLNRWPADSRPRRVLPIFCGTVRKD